jgi:hypothetical protein
MSTDLNFRITIMPDSRPADYYLSCLEDSVFMDFDNCNGECIRLRRISFDRYGCCDLNGEAIPMSEADSKVFKEMMEAEKLEQSELAIIIKNTIFKNREFIWEDAVNEYGLGLNGN